MIKPQTLTGQEANMNNRERAKELAELSRQIQEGEEETQEQVDKLQQALEAAKTKLVEQNEMLTQLTSAPLVYATVVALSKQRSEVVNFEQEGLRVRLDSDSEYSYQNDGIGTVKPYHLDGWVKVIFDDGYSNHYRTGKKVSGDSDCDGFCDLVLAEEEKAADTAVIAVEGKFLEVLLPKGIEVNPGDTVTVVMETMQIVDVASVQIGSNIGYVRRVIDETLSEVDYESSVKVVFNGKLGESLEKGDRVVLDATISVIVRNLGKEDERFSFAAEMNVSWDNIGGLTEAKRLMKEAVELPHNNPDIFRFYGKRPVKGVLLYGPPGCGKTMLGKATATSLANIYNGNGSSTGFIYIKGPEILDRFVGVAEATVRQIFQRARKHKEDHGYPAVIFIDEADAILAKRGSGISSDIERTIVPMFLTEMDGLEDSGALVILATNRSDILDPAVVRDGRIDRKIKIDRPAKESATEIFLLGLKDVPLDNGYTYNELAELASTELFSENRVLYQISTKTKGDVSFTLGNVVNGGMVMSIVDQATSIALHRDLDQNETTGLCKDDLVAAVNVVERQNRDLNHTDEIKDFVHDFRDDVVNIQRLRQESA